MRKLNIYTLFLLSIVGLSSCEKFLEPELNSSQVTNENVFSSDVNAITAINGLYRVMSTNAFSGGGNNGLSNLVGLSSDELHNFMQDNSYTYFRFEKNDILANDLMLEEIWSKAYQTIYQANDIIEGVQKSTKLSTTTRNQLVGEALFVRSFCYFYLVNLFGDVPFVVSTEYKVNRLLPRKNQTEIYSDIVKDLLQAQDLVSDKYTVTERVRPNKFAVKALLSRIYLFLKDWKNAEIFAGEVISQSQYKISNDLNGVFKKESQETIWQLSSEGPYNTNDGVGFIIQYGPGTSTSILTETLLNAFETGDMRKANWISVFNYPPNLHYPFKYKSNGYDAPITEHSIVLRLAEQHLIRAEALAKQNILDRAILDVDILRTRAGLAKIGVTRPSINQSDLLTAIEHERQVELFAEWGHRWLDLKRANRAISQLSAIKPTFSVNDLLYPIPQSEFLKHPNLGNQNIGY